jgi:ATP-dependent DNA helicase RecG
MTRFKRGEIQILVATTVIEVGVDVPNATIMVIENAERFGLSQLHQLRGRVGRGSEQSYCVLMAGKNQLSGTTAKRLNALVESNDGFRIAEIDLQLRGPGDFLGTKQSGLPTFRHADIVTDSELIQQARAAAFEIIAQDPELRMQEHALLRQYFRHYCQRFKFEDLLA